MRGCGSSASAYHPRARRPFRGFRARLTRLCGRARWTDDDSRARARSCVPLDRTLGPIPRATAGRDQRSRAPERSAQAGRSASRDLDRSNTDQNRDHRNRTGRCGLGADRGRKGHPALGPGEHRGDPPCRRSQIRCSRFSGPHRTPCRFGAAGGSRRYPRSRSSDPEVPGQARNGRIDGGARAIAPGCGTARARSDRARSSREYRHASRRVRPLLQSAFREVSHRVSASPTGRCGCGGTTGDPAGRRGHRLRHGLRRSIPSDPRVSPRDRAHARSLSSAPRLLLRRSVRSTGRVLPPKDGVLHPFNRRDAEGPMIDALSLIT